MREHHAKALQKAQARLLGQSPEILAILLGGSIAKGADRDESDVDLIVVVPDSDYAKRLDEDCVSFFWRDIPGYKDGLVEGRYISRSFLDEAAARGSEPTRHSFAGVYPVYCTDPEIPKILPLIPVYPEDLRKERMSAFYSQLQCNRTFYWDQGKHNEYLKLRAASEMACFGCRMILAYNRILFPCQRRLVECTLAAPVKPDGFEGKMNAFLASLTDEAMEAFCRSLEEFADWGSGDRYIRDVEMSWFNKVHAVSEW